MSAKPKKRSEPNLRRFKRYPVYTNSGIEWLGEIPTHWSAAPVYARYEVALGKMLDSKRVTGQSSGRYLRNVDVQWDSINTIDLPEMDFPPSERDRYLLRPGDLLVCEGGEVGRTAIWGGEIEECFYQKAIHRVRPRTQDEDPRFLYYLMSALAKRGVFSAGGNQNTIDHLTAVQLRHYRLPFAPPNEQRDIAAFLDRETARIDALVAKKERLIELLDENCRAFITNVLTQGLRATVPMKTTGLQYLHQIPEHWDVGPLSRWWQVLDCKHRTTPFFDDGVPVASIGEVQGMTVDLTTAKRTSVEEYRLMIEGGRDPRPGDILYSRNATVGAASIVTAKSQFCMGQDVSLIRSTGQEPLFLLFLLKNSVISAQLSAVMIGSTFNRINVTDIKQLRVIAPPIEEQRSIADACQRTYAKTGTLTSKVREAIDCLKELRAALILAAITGQIDVREEVA